MRVTLGGIELKVFEKPESIPLGGQNQLAIREFPGGNKSIQNFGPTYRSISWSGIFIGSDAYERMVKIGNMRVAGKPIVLATDRLTLNVVIKEFYPDYKTDNRIPFSITLERIIEQKQGGKPTDSVDKAALFVSNSTSNIGTEPTKYVVQTGDTLSKIAARLKGDPNKWEEIYRSNQTVLKNGPHDLKVGMVLYV